MVLNLPRAAGIAVQNMSAVAAGARHKCVGSIQRHRATRKLFGRQTPHGHGIPGGAAAAMKHATAVHPGEIAGDFDRAAMEFIIAAILGFAGKRGSALPPVVGRAEFEDDAVPGAITGAEQDAPVADVDIAAETTGTTGHVACHVVVTAEFEYAQPAPAVRRRFLLSSPGPKGRCSPQILAVQRACAEIPSANSHGETRTPSA